MQATDFTRIEHGPYGARWSYEYDPEEGGPPSVEKVEQLLGVKLAQHTYDASGERGDELCEEVYFAADEYDENTLETYRVQ
jgi:hypothetical protein